MEPEKLVMSSQSSASSDQASEEQSKVFAGARQGLENMLSLKSGEKVTIVTDFATMNETQDAFVEVAKQITGKDNVTIYVLEDSGERPLKAMPNGLDASVMASDVTMFVAQSMGEELDTVRRPMMKAVSKSSARHGHCPGFKKRMMMEGMAADYNIVYALSKALVDLLSNTRRINVTTPKGTNLIVDVDSQHFPWVPSQPVKKGQLANLPDGEVFCTPYNVNGTAVIDGCVGDFLNEKYGHIKDTPIYVNIQAGMAVDISCLGNKDLEYDLRTYVFNLNGKKEFLTRKVGEFALGTNLGVTGFMGKMLQDEKCGRAIHFAFGDPLDEDGTGAGYECKGHIDLVVVDPTVKANNSMIIMDNGLYTEEVMRHTLKYLPSGYALSKIEEKLTFVKVSGR